MEYLALIVILVVAGLAWVIHGLQNDQIRRSREDLENFKEVLDEKRKIDNKLNSDPDYARRVRDKYNDPT